MPVLNHALMENNITDDDLNKLIEFLKTSPRLTQSEQVRRFEQDWNRWLGSTYSVFVSSGSAANLLTMTALRRLYGEGEVIVPTLTWISDIVSVLVNGFTPIFIDIDPSNLCMATDIVLSKLNNNSRAVFLTHVQGFNGLTQKLIDVLKEYGIPLIEDVCESYGATFNGAKLGTFGLASNFSFYYAHHMSTIEGGMISTDDRDLYEMLRMLRGHGMVREAEDAQLKKRYASDFPDLNPEFIFAHPGLNCRGTEIGGFLGRLQLKRLDEQNEKRRQNLSCFLEQLDESKYRTDFNVKGNCNYAFPLVIKTPDEAFRKRLEKTLNEANVEFRRGSSGGGNQLRQPYLRERPQSPHFENFPEVEHIHHFGYYIGNYPSLTKERIKQLCQLINSVK